MDGVSETKSTSTSLDVYSLKFDGCREIYPLKIIRPLNKFPLDHREQLSFVVDAIVANSLNLKTLVADNPKRAFLKFVLQHGARFGCEYCFQPGILFKNNNQEDCQVFIENIDSQISVLNEQINSIEGDSEEKKTFQSVVNNLTEAKKIAKQQKQHSQIVWPANTMNGELRTKEKILEIVEEIESGSDLSPTEKKGIKGRSILLNLENFDMVNSSPTEYMHSVCIGLVKRLLELCFSVGENRSRNIKRPLTSPALFDELIKLVKVFHEFSRRVRKLDLAVLKAQELRNILLFFFPIITKCLNNSEKEVKLWEMLAFMIRACILPQEEYLNVNINQIKYCQKTFYSSYEQLYGLKNCTLTVHVVIAHLLNMRHYGPLTESSAFRFEAFYSELRHAFQPGTVSVLKQMFQNVLLKRILSKHVCYEKIYLSEKDTALECNSLIYLFENCQYLI